MDLLTLPRVRSLHVHEPLYSQDLISNYTGEDSDDNLKRNVNDLLSSLEALHLPTSTYIVFIGCSFGSMIIKEVCNSFYTSSGVR